MPSVSTLRERLKLKRDQLDLAMDGYTSLLSGMAQSYSIGSRNITKLNINDLERVISNLEKEIETIENQLSGRKPRKAVGVIPRDF